MSKPEQARERGDRLLASVSQENPVVAWTFIGGLVALSWLVSYGLGGTKSVGPHLFYIPLLIAAFRFGAPGALVVAGLCGVVAGPALPLDVEAGTRQDYSGWLGRLVAFIAVGQVTAALASRSLPVSRQRLDDHSDRTELQRAAANGEFFPVYQPIVDLVDGGIVGVEALARRRRADGELVSPAEFIPAAERTGAITMIDRAILEQACRQLVSWRRAGIVSDSFYVSVNLSAHHLHEADLAVQIGALLESTEVPLGRVVLEITETALVTDPRGASQRLWELKDLGLSIALDDLGVGYSSLSALGRFPIDVVKIDRSFVVDVVNGARQRGLVEGVMRLAEAVTGARPVAEGIETAAQVETLRSLGCVRGQGFLFQRPACAEDLEPTLRAGRCGTPRGGSVPG